MQYDWQTTLNPAELEAASMCDILRTKKVATQERMTEGHYFGDGADDGTHKGETANIKFGVSAPGALDNGVVHYELGNDIFRYGNAGNKQLREGSILVSFYAPPSYALEEAGVGSSFAPHDFPVPALGNATISIAVFPIIQTAHVEVYHPAGLLLYSQIVFGAPYSWTVVSRDYPSHSLPGSITIRHNADSLQAIVITIEKSGRSTD